MDTDWPDARNLTIGQRIRLARLKQKDLTQERLGEALGVSRANVNQWEKDVHGPERGKLSSLAEALHCPAAWLLSGEGSTVVREHSNAEYIALPTERPRVPLVSHVPGGPGSEATDPYSRGSAQDWLVPSNAMSAESFALRVVGDSMEPEFVEGCVIFVDPAVKPKHGDNVVVRFDESNEATLKQLSIDGDRMFLKPLNPRYPIRELDHGTIVGVVREQRKVYR